MPDLSLETIDDDISRRDMVEEEVEELVSCLNAGEGRYDELDVLVHPGYTERRGAWEAYEFLDEGMYEEYCEEFDVYCDGLDGGVAVLYPLPEYEEVKEDVDIEDAEYVATLPNSGVLHPEERERFGSLLTDVADDGVVRVSGELNGICVDHVSGMVAQSVEEAGRDIVVEEHLTFPRGKIGELYGKTYLTEVEGEYGSGPSIGEFVREMVPFTG